MQHDLDKLGPTGFQDLVGALLTARFGPAIRVMGRGRDGSRDLYLQGSLVWSRTGERPGQAWDGYNVFQVKHKERVSSRPSDDASWLWAQVKSELDAWVSAAPGRENIPDAFIVVTNIRLTPVPNVGERNRFISNFDSYKIALGDATRDLDDAEERRFKFARASRIKHFRVIDGNDLDAWLGVYDGVRKDFSAFFSPADILTSLHNIADGVSASDLEPGLRSHARTSLIGEGMIYFDEAGSGDGTPTSLHEVAVDLPVSKAGERIGSVVRYVLQRGDHVLRSEAGSFFEGPKHLILVGAPGNGKTTISKFLVQAYRAAFMEGADRLSGEQRRVIAGTGDALKHMQTGPPSHRRWPIRIDLSEFVQSHGHEIDLNLFRYVAERVAKRSDTAGMTPRALRAWLKRWPWFVVLDGLDEVTEPRVRKRLVESVLEFVEEADANRADLFVLLTTRPVGFTETIAPHQFERIDLANLSVEEAVAYGRRVTRVRLHGDLDRIEKVDHQIARAAEDESLRILLRTPLQVLIMTIIASSSGRFSPDRYGLFASYYDIVVRRERDKINPLAQVLREHATLIEDLHSQVGFELQAASEQSEHARATLTVRELRDIAWQAMFRAGFDPDGRDADLLRSILDAATKRLVLIAPHGDHGFGFDVRSLQELMAAMFLTNAPLDKMIERLNACAPSPHWRNTWVFAAGRLFSRPQHHEHAALIELIERLDAEAPNRLGMRVPSAPRLALDLLDDGMVRGYPAWRRRLSRLGLRVLLEPFPLDLSEIARALARFADSGDEQRSEVAEGIRDALSFSRFFKLTTESVQSRIFTVCDEIHARPQTRGLRSVRQRSGAVMNDLSQADWTSFADVLDAAPLPEGVGSQIKDAVQNLASAGTVSPTELDILTGALYSRREAVALEDALAYLVPADAKLFVCSSR